VAHTCGHHLRNGPFQCTTQRTTTTVAGSFVYAPAAGSVLSAGTDSLTATFTPTDTANYTTATKTVQLTVGQATPPITWAAPASISCGTALSSGQLNAASPVAGSFAYTRGVFNYPPVFLNSGPSQIWPTTYLLSAPASTITFCGG
jgi:hypothetical protein